MLWTFAQEPPFYDERVALAVATLVDAEFRAVDARVFYVASHGPDLVPYVDEPPAPADQVPLLLAAAGFPDEFSPLEVVGPCKVYVAPVDQATRPAAEKLATLFKGALTELGAEVGPCQFTESAAKAHILVWTQGQPAPDTPQRQQSTLLALPNAAPSPSPDSVAPPRTGNGGLKSH